MKFIRLKTIIFFASAAASVSSLAATDCKTLSKDQCVKETAQCTWIKSYERKDGKIVDAYCRAKPKKSAASGN